ncbi:hypothetical protein [Tessaracoccus sp. MC1756]|nr:hypothetical protein [Tessaracoccus sp. MC1756]
MAALGKAANAEVGESSALRAGWGGSALLTVAQLAVQLRALL